MAVTRTFILLSGKGFLWVVQFSACRPDSFEFYLPKQTEQKKKHDPSKHPHAVSG